jgi:hypothetical protein
VRDMFWDGGGGGCLDVGGEEAGEGQVGRWPRWGARFVGCQVSGVGRCVLLCINARVLTGWMDGQYYWVEFVLG